MRAGPPIHYIHLSPGSRYCHGAPVPREGARVDPARQTAGLGAGRIGERAPALAGARTGRRRGPRPDRTAAAPALTAPTTAPIRRARCLFWRALPALRAPGRSGTAATAQGPRPVAGGHPRPALRGGGRGRGPKPSEQGRFRPCEHHRPRGRAARRNGSVFGRKRATQPRPPPNSAGAPTGSNRTGREARHPALEGTTSPGAQRHPRV